MDMPTVKEQIRINKFFEAQAIPLRVRLHFRQILKECQIDLCENIELKLQAERIVWDLQDVLLDRIGKPSWDDVSEAEGKKAVGDMIGSPLMQFRI